MADYGCGVTLESPTLQLWVRRYIQQNLDGISGRRSLANANAIEKASVAPQAVAQREPILAEPRVSPEDVPRLDVSSPLEIDTRDSHEHFKGGILTPSFVAERAIHAFFDGDSVQSAMAHVPDNLYDRRGSLNPQQLHEAGTPILHLAIDIEKSSL